jgi:hypothetical protein
MAMNFAPLDCSCQGASSEPKPGFFRFREIRKKTKNPYFWLPQQKWVQWPELLLYLNSTHPIQ